MSCTRSVGKLYKMLLQSSGVFAPENVEKIKSHLRLAEHALLPDGRLDARVYETLKQTLNNKKLAQEQFFAIIAIQQIDSPDTARLLFDTVQKRLKDSLPTRYVVSGLLRMTKNGEFYVRDLFFSNRNLQREIIEEILDKSDVWESCGWHQELMLTAALEEVYPEKSHHILVWLIRQNAIDYQQIRESFSSQQGLFGKAEKSERERFVQKVFEICRSMSKSGENSIGVQRGIAFGEAFLS